jgi:signal transduction histidine kinase
LLPNALAKKMGVVNTKGRASTLYPLEFCMSEARSTFAAYVNQPDESARLAAYELGRRALADGVGLMQWIGIVCGVVVEAIQSAPTDTDRAVAAAAAEGFIFECLSAYEMSFQGAREANDALRHQNDLLEHETRRIAHEIHDSASQLMAGAYFELHFLAQNGSPELVARVARVTDLLDQVQGDLRRISHELRPTILDDLGLLPALRELGAGLATRSGMVVSIEGSTEGRLPPPVEVALYRTVQEALTNTVKHSGAARAEVRVERRGHDVHCTVTDDGVGFNRAAAASTGGLGLVGLRERLAPLGGSIRWGSAPGERGAVVTAVIPLEVPHVPSRLGR